MYEDVIGFALGLYKPPYPALISLGAIFKLILALVWSLPAPEKNVYLESDVPLSSAATL